MEANVTKHLKQASAALEALSRSRAQSNQQQLEDAPALYGQLLAEKLRRLPKRNRIVLQNKIDNLVFEAELEVVDDLASGRPDSSNENISFVQTPLTSPSENYISSAVSSPSNAPSPVFYTSSDNPRHFPQTNYNSSSQEYGLPQTMTTLSTFYSNAHKVLNDDEV